MMATEDKPSGTNLVDFQHQMLDLYMGSLKVMPMLSNLHEIVIENTPYDVVFELDKIKLLRYRSTNPRSHKTPLLIVYALINRHYILDLENLSAIRSLLNEGFDIYLIDWGTPDAEDYKLTINDYVNRYMDNCVDIVRKLSNIEKISLFGYCMGGTFSAIYTTMHTEKVKNLITLAPPIDCSKETTVFGAISKFLDVDNMVDTLGNIPSSFQHLFFTMLKPFKHYVQRYYEVSQRIDDKVYLENFMRLEKWLWDTVPLPGEVFRQWIKDIYQKNLLVQNKLQVGGQTIDLRKIDVPLLNIVADLDHLVSPESSKALNQLVSSKDNTNIAFPTGHVGLCASTFALKEVWPKVAQWLVARQ